MLYADAVSNELYSYKAELWCRFLGPCFASMIESQRTSAILACAWDTDNIYTLKTYQAVFS